MTALGHWRTSQRRAAPLTPAVDRDVAKFLSKLPEELEHYSELLYNQRARPVPRKQ